MSESMETQADNIESVPTSSNADSPKDFPSLLLDESAPADEINILNDLTSPEQILIDDTPDTAINTGSADPPLEETTTPMGEETTTTPMGEEAQASNSTGSVAVSADQCLSHSKTASDTVEFDRALVLGSARTNSLWAVCQVCKSKILQPNVGVLVEREAELPPLLKKESLNTTTQEIPVERVLEFWKIKDMFHFENIGVSKTIGSTKYLLCADCEIGPVGYHLITNPQAFFLAANRVVYANNV